MGWKIGGGLLAALAILGAIIAATTAPEYKTGSEWGFAVVFAILAAVFFWKGAKASARKKAARRNVNRTFMTDQDLELIQAGELPVVTDVPVVLAEGEVARYYAPAVRFVTKTKAVGRTGGHGGVSVRVAKGVSVRSGRGASQTVYDDVTDRFEGRVVLTDQRIVFLAVQGGFDCKLDKVSAIIPEGDRIMVQAGSNAYRLAVEHQGHFEKVLEAVARK